VNKPSGILVHPSPDSTRHDVDFALDRAEAAIGAEKLWPVHRLDKPTSGILVFARSSGACAALTAQWGELQDDSLDSAESANGASLPPPPPPPPPPHGVGSGSDCQNTPDTDTDMADAELDAAWAMLCADDPAPFRSNSKKEAVRPRGKPPPALLAALRTFSNRKKCFLAGLSGAQHFRVTGKWRQNAKGCSVSVRTRTVVASDGDSRVGRKSMEVGETGSGGGGENKGVEQGGTLLELGLPFHPRRRRVVKQYIGCVYGCLIDSVVCDQPLSKHPTMKEKRQRKLDSAAHGADCCKCCGVDHPTGSSGFGIPTEGVTLDRGSRGCSCVGGGSSSGSCSGGGSASGAGVSRPSRPKLLQECRTIFTREAPLWMYEGSHRVSLVRIHFVLVHFLIIARLCVFLCSAWLLLWVVVGGYCCGSGSNCCCCCVECCFTPTTVVSTSTLTTMLQL
jgi:hypothetical protein